ncbi:hypothetical protein JQS43_08970 [Natronosporangium hydrolyticum]|uniref:Uncharacterized protein n=1 Tax=Natronosporangium hydrolyticum TaxID=2811111 RepID=A0A895YFN8_9ACTN|nr:hypothetical protein [Natronosporangium hydrolyticum]QSB16391.1 hypothetical protein JQS43_08970 [Natronosporangium hydrolyticum]
MTQLTHPQLAPTGATPRTRVVLILVAAAVTIVEIAAVLASFGAEPFARRARPGEETAP